MEKERTARGGNSSLRLALRDDRRINSCLTFAAMCEGAKITTIEGLANGDELHPMQAALGIKKLLLSI